MICFNKGQPIGFICCDLPVLVAVTMTPSDGRFHPFIWHPFVLKRKTAAILNSINSITGIHSAEPVDIAIQLVLGGWMDVEIDKYPFLLLALTTGCQAIGLKSIELSANHPA